VGRPRTFAAYGLCTLAVTSCALAGATAAASTHSGSGSVPRCAKRSTYRTGSGTGPSCRRSRGGANAVCPFTRLRPQPWNLGRVRYAVLCLVNRERARHGEAALRPNWRLGRVAQSHSDSMARAGYFGHDGPGGSPLNRMRAAGYVSRARGYDVGENIAFGTLWLSTPRAIVSSWMHSPGHRANILDGRFRDTAIGVAPRMPWSFSHGQPGAIYTQDFGVVIRGR
jgi:uncharacterized protein YkwD